MDSLLKSFDRQVRRAMHPERTGVRTEVDGQVYRTVGLDHRGWFAVAWSSLDSQNADQVISEQVGYFSGLTESFEWKCYDYDTPGDLEQRLIAHGFVRGEDESVMVIDVDRLPRTPPPDGIRLVEASTDEHIDALVSVHEQVFKEDQERFREQLKYQIEHLPSSVTCVIAYAAERAVAASRIDFPEDSEFAGLWGGGTLPEFERRGIYRAMVSHRADRAAERGYRYVYVDASSQSRPILERLGFKRIARTTPYTQYYPRP